MAEHDISSFLLSFSGGSEAERQAWVRGWGDDCLRSWRLLDSEGCGEGAHNRNFRRHRQQFAYCKLFQTSSLFRAAPFGVDRPSMNSGSVVKFLGIETMKRRVHGVISYNTDQKCQASYILPLRLAKQLPYRHACLEPSTSNRVHDGEKGHGPVSFRTW